MGFMNFYFFTKYFFIKIFIVLYLILNLFLSLGICAESAKTPSSEEAILQEKGGVLLPKGTLVIEPGFQYSHTSRARIAISGFTILEAIVIGKIKTEDIKKDVFMGYLNFRYGLLNNLQLEAQVPYMYRKERYAYKEDSSTTEKTVTDSNIGDISFGASYQILYEKGSIPDVVLNFKVKTKTGKDPYHIETNDKGIPKELPTGNGHWGISGGITLVKRSDPAVLFGSLAYFYNFKRNVEGYGEMKPGSSIDFSIGMAYALNEKLSTYISYDQKIYSHTTQEGEDVVGTDFNVGMLYFGTSYVISPKTSLNFSVGVGLTNDAPDVTVEIRLPIKF